MSKAKKTWMLMVSAAGTSMDLPRPRAVNFGPILGVLGVKVTADRHGSI
jgi:hypothetical protein